MMTNEFQTTAGIVTSLAQIEPGWEQDGARTAMRRTTGGNESLNFYYDGDRVSVSGRFGVMPDGSQWYPSAYGNGPKNPKATFSVTRPSAQVARAIVSKILPDYRVLFAEYLDRRDGAAKFRDDSEVTKARLHDVGGEILRRDNDANSEAIYTTSACPASTMLRVYGKSVRFEYFSVDADLAVEIVSLLAKHKKVV